MTETTVTPEYVKESAGFADITLRSAATIAGAKVSFVRMREPTAGDHLAYSEQPGSEAAKEIALFANLCEIAPEDIRALTVRNYRRLQDAYGVFTA